ncbi:S1C family serine protease [Metabacillus indicus]|uniref:S1C family serine protease n=1 Tax=Metabacillus indicus TaxID=246786 RepID=UPI001F21D710|nr:trypsin-like peptidase domain-containing protein [Metabacillus indicus]
MWALTITMLLICVGVIGYLGLELTEQKPVEKMAAAEKTIREQPPESQVKKDPVKKPEAVPAAAEVEKAPKEVSEIIQDAQPKVFTIFSDYSQGSGFLINGSGDILTNAHVVEGSLDVTVRSSQGEELTGSVIGYSNEVDIAVIRVAGLSGQEPLELELGEPSKLGDEVIALGSPKGYENTATLGNISGVGRTFYIPPHEYEGIYQISAPIAPGSSGGPLLDKNTEKAIAINSARDNQEVNIGFSIPIYKVMNQITDWVNQPMTAEEVAALFYTVDGLYFYQDLYDNEYYFDGGEYSEEFEDSGTPEDEYYDEYESETPEDPYYDEDYSDDEYIEEYEDVPADEYSEDMWDEPAEDMPAAEDEYIEEDPEYPDGYYEEPPVEEVPFEEEPSEENPEPAEPADSESEGAEEVPGGEGF